MINQEALDLLFYNGRSYNNWQNKEIPENILHKLYELTFLGPTSANCLPLRIVFVKSLGEKEKLKTTLAPGNIEKTMSAPVTAILGFDMKFYEHLPQLFPHTDAKSWFVGNDQMIYDTAFRNSSLQAGYFIMAARSLGLDTGAMSGFDNAKVDQLFFAGTSIKSNFLCNLGYGDKTTLHGRLPRLSFDQSCKIV